MRKSLLSAIVIVLLVAIHSTAGMWPGYQYVYPLPNSKRVSPQTTIIIRLHGELPKNVSSFITVKNQRGAVDGTTRLASDHRTVIFQPTHPFALGATIHVSLSPFHSAAAQQNYHFEIAESPALHSGFVPEDEPEPDGPVQTTDQAADENGARIMPNGVSVPSDFPHINVTTNSAPGDGYIFLNNRGRNTPYNIIFDNDGSPVWYLKTDDRRRDFKVQRNGTITMLARSGGHRFLNFDVNFRKIGEYSAVNGYSTDEHECVITEDGHVLLIGRKETNVDMRQYVAGGRRNATVRETIVQEFTPEGDKIFEWRAWDHFEDIIQHLETVDLTGGYIRFPHMNAIDIDDDGHIILSSRNLSEISKIHRQTGEFIWRLGGPKNEFTFVNDDLDRFSNQHAVLSLGNNRYTMFDNGTSRTPSVSRGVEYVLDVENKTATLVWEYRNPPGTSYSHYMGNHQRLPNGNSLINWAVIDRPKATEVTPDGNVVYEMDWASPDECYRAFRFPWDGVVARPNLFVESGGSHIILLFNKFGDENVAYYNIYGGPSKNPTTVIDTSKATLKRLSDLQNKRRYFFRVRAVMNDGSMSPYSREENIYVNIKETKTNMVLNWDFSRSKRDWKHETHHSAQSSWTAVTREGHIKIENGGRERRSIAFYQGEMPMVNGKEYLFEFEAYADQARIIEVMVCQANNPDRNYSKIGLVSLTDRKQKFSYVYTMEENTDYAAELRFHVGADEADVFIDNVVLRENVDVSVNTAESVMPSDFELIGNFPNPFNPATTIHYHLPQQSRVQITVYTVLGRQVFQTHVGDQAAGEQYFDFDASELNSGIYFYQVKARTASGTVHRAVDKMMLVK